MATEAEPFVFTEGMPVTATTSNGEELTGGVIIGYAVKFPGRASALTFGSDELAWAAASVGEQCFEHDCAAPGVISPFGQPMCAQHYHDAGGTQI